MFLYAYLKSNAMLFHFQGSVRILYLETHSEDVFRVGRSTQDGDTNNILPEVYGAVFVLDRVKETAGK